METKDTINSCLMMGANLNTPVSLWGVFDSADLKDTGIELDSHITLLYAPGLEIPYKDLRTDVKDVLGVDGYETLLKYIKGEREYRVLDIFDIGSFENDSDYVVLKLKKGELFDILNFLNKSLRLKYDVSSDFDSYTPHVSLAELNPGTAKKYIESETLNLVLRDSFINFEDLFVSYGTTGERDRRQYFLTHFNCVDRYFRLERLKRETEE